MAETMQQLGHTTQQVPEAEIAHNYSLIMHYSYWVLPCFLQVLNKLPTVMVQLFHECSESSHACLQMVVNMTCAMMTAFPRNDDMYTLVIGALKVSLSKNQFVLS
jgi:hypothetical protein